VLPVIVAWAGLALLAWGPGRHGMAMGSSSSGVASSSGRMAGHGVGPATTTADWAAAAAYLRGIAMWEVMVAAMMLPATIPLVRHVAFATRRTRRQRSIALLCLGYLLAWLPLGAVTAVWHVLGVAPGAAAVVAAVALISAGVWELTPMKVRALRRCHRTLPIRYSGRAVGSLGVAARAGQRAGVRPCLRARDGRSGRAGPPDRRDAARRCGDACAGDAPSG